MPATKKPNRVREDILEMTDDMHRIGLMSDATHQQITVRLLGRDPLPTAAPISAAEIRAVREQAHLSQAAFARYLNLSVGYVSQLERGTKDAKGPALALFNVLRRKGFDALL